MQSECKKLALFPSYIHKVLIGIRSLTRSILNMVIYLIIVTCLVPQHILKVLSDHHSNLPVVLAAATISLGNLAYS